MTSLPLLRDRLVEAKEGSAELDRLIADAVLTEPQEARLVGSPAPIKMWRHPDGSIGTELRYSQSLDAALTLVPTGLEWSVESHHDTKDGFYAWVGPYRYGQQDLHRGATPALALCIAALEARTALSEESVK